MRGLRAVAGVVDAGSHIGVLGADHPCLLRVAGARGGRIVGPGILGDEQLVVVDRVVQSCGSAGAVVVVVGVPLVLVLLNEVLLGQVHDVVVLYQLAAFDRSHRGECPTRAATCLIPDGRDEALEGIPVQLGVPGGRASRGGSIMAVARILDPCCDSGRGPAGLLVRIDARAVDVEGSRGRGVQLHGGRLNRIEGRTGERIRGRQRGALLIGEQRVRELVGCERLGGIMRAPVEVGRHLDPGAEIQQRHGAT